MQIKNTPSLDKCSDVLIKPLIAPEWALDRSDKVYILKMFTDPAYCQLAKLNAKRLQGLYKDYLEISEIQPNLIERTKLGRVNMYSVFVQKIATRINYA
jgi:hypothetical protein